MAEENVEGKAEEKVEEVAEEKVDDNLKPVGDVAAILGVRPQLLYNLIRKDKLTTPGKRGRSKVVDIDEARIAVETEAARVKSPGGRNINWAALTNHLKAGNKDKAIMKIGTIRKIVETETAKLEMLHYWDPYRAAGNQGNGLKAIRAAGYELISIKFDYSEFIDMLGVAVVNVIKKETEAV